MNLLLLFPEDFVTPTHARITGRRCRHLLEVLCTAPGQPLRVGLLDGLLGEARVISQNNEQIDLAVQLTTPPRPRYH